MHRLGISPRHPTLQRVLEQRAVDLRAKTDGVDRRADRTHQVHDLSERVLAPGRVAGVVLVTAVGQYDHGVASWHAA